MSKTEEYKQKISLLDFALAHGFQFKDDRGTSKKEIRLTNGDEQIIISRYEHDDTKEYYFKISEGFGTNSSRSVIDFVQEFVLQKSLDDKINFREIFDILDRYLNNPLFVPNKQENIVVPISKPKFEQQLNIEEVKKHLELIYPKVSTFDYLESRGIKKETYNSPVFQKTFGTFFFQFSNSKTYENTAFVFCDKENKMQNIQQIIERKTADKKIERTKLFLKNAPRNNTLYKSAMKRKDRINSIVLCEAVEDCMAHYQLSKNDPLLKNKEDAIPKFPYYIATGGAIAQQQLEHITEIVHENKKPIILAYDNDKTGELYTLKTLLAISEVEVQLATKKIDNIPYLSFQFKSYCSMYRGESGIIDGYLFNTLENKVNGKYTDLKIPKELSEWTSEEFKDVIDVPHTSNNVQIICQQLIKDIREEMKLRCLIHRPITKDWVEDIDRKNRLKIKVHQHPTIGR